MFCLNMLVNADTEIEDKVKIIKNLRFSLPVFFTFVICRSIFNNDKLF
ncbi:hypothetical protein O9A_00953 [Bartonella koehlerae C-29]|uniref:Uncharacterized protein n=1 Tax=Bartonella koehlerae C-29 TaxID=1134510 RepID=A0A067WE58_9HYPH|nr:hypothetical protein O9A_00953 [Bartonella koehlerae C-29]